MAASGAAALVAENLARHVRNERKTAISGGHNYDDHKLHTDKHQHHHFHDLKSKVCNFFHSKKHHDHQLFNCNSTQKNSFKY